MAAMKVTRRYSFSASHRLHSAQLSAERNREIFGKCNNPHGHGHNYVLEVTVRGPVEPETGLVVNLKSLDGLVRDQVLTRYDHCNLNSDVTAFRDVPPTTENLTTEIRKDLARHWPAAFPALERIRIHETDRNIFEESASHA